MIYSKGFSLFFLCFVLHAFSYSNPKKSNEIIIEKKHFVDTVYLQNLLGKNEKLVYYNGDEINGSLQPLYLLGVDSGHIASIKSNGKITFLIQNGNFILYPVIFNSGEHVLVRIKDNQPNFILENDDIRTNELMFFQDLFNNINIPKAPQQKIESKNDYVRVKNLYQNWYGECLNYLNNFSIKMPISDSFKSGAKEYLKYYQLSLFLNPSLFSSPFALLDSLKSYQDTFLNSANVTNFSFKWALYGYNLLMVKTIVPNPNFQDIYNYADSTYNGAMKKYLLYQVLLNNVNTEMNDSTFKNKMRIYIKTYSQDTLAKSLRNNFQYILSDNSRFEKGDFSEENVINKNGDDISWNRIIESNKGKVLCIDFWASWCAPCIAELPYSFKLKKEFENKDIEFLYVSIDAGKQRWLDASGNLGFPQMNNCFMVKKIQGSKIKEHFKIETIPRIIVYNKSGDVVSIDAPAPSDPALKKLLNKLMAE